MAKETLTMPRFNRVTMTHPQKRRPVPLSAGLNVSSSISECSLVIIRPLALFRPLHPSLRFKPACG